MAGSWLVPTFLSFLSTTLAHDNICVWHGELLLDRFNGDYILTDTLYNDYPVWQTAPTPSPTSYSCPIEMLYIYVTNTGSSLQWVIQLGLSSGYDSVNSAVCQKSVLPSSPLDCSNVWVLDGSPSAMSVNEVCPIADCETLDVSNLGFASCDQTFTHTAEFGVDNVFVSSDSLTYFFFNAKTFKWHCSNDVDQVTECDGAVSIKVTSQAHDAWFDLSDGVTQYIPFKNSATATITCSGSLPASKAPTEATSIPTQAPVTNAPTLPTEFPTEIPTSDPIHALTTGMHSTENAQDEETTLDEGTLIIIENGNSVVLQVSIGAAATICAVLMCMVVVLMRRRRVAIEVKGAEEQMSDMHQSDDIVYAMQQQLLQAQPQTQQLKK